jgi:hypothetical protein
MLASANFECDQATADPHPQSTHQIQLLQKQIVSLASQFKIMQASHQASGWEVQLRTGMVQTGMIH